MVLVGLILALVFALRARSQRAALDTWRKAARPALDEANAARSLLHEAEARTTVDRRDSVDAQVERAAGTLDRLAPTAPNDAQRLAASTSASSLRSLMFALEADRLLRSGDQPPTAVQLSEADEARRERAAELDAALAELTAQVVPEEAVAPPTA